MGFRYPVEIISHAGWLYFRFALSLRDVSELMLASGVVVLHETIRQWTQKFGQGYANALRRRRPRPGDKWHMDEVCVKINGGGITSGGPSIRTGSYSMSWCSAAATQSRRRSSSASCSRACGTCLG